MQGASLVAQEEDVFAARQYLFEQPGEQADHLDSLEAFLAVPTHKFPDQHYDLALKEVDRGHDWLRFRPAVDVDGHVFQDHDLQGEAGHGVDGLRRPVDSPSVLIFGREPVFDESVEFGLAPMSLGYAFYLSGLWRDAHSMTVGVRVLDLIHE